MDLGSFINAMPSHNENKHNNLTVWIIFLIMPQGSVKAAVGWMYVIIIFHSKNNPNMYSWIDRLLMSFHFCLRHVHLVWTSAFWPNKQTHLSVWMVSSKHYSSTFALKAFYTTCCIHLFIQAPLLCFLCNIHTHSHNGCIREHLWVSISPRIFGIQTGPARDWTTNLPTSQWPLNPELQPPLNTAEQE